MATGKVKIVGGVVGLRGGDFQIASPEITTTSPVGQRQDVDLVLGDNTITIPSGTKALIFIPPATNTQALTLKGAAADTGIALSKTNPICLAFEASPASIIITSGGTVSNCVVIFV